MLKKIFYLFITLVFIFYYGLYIEPQMIITKHYTFPYNPNNKLDFKIIQFSDTHLQNQKDVDKLRKIVQKINSINPDFIVFTGDLISDIRKFPYKEEVLTLLTEMKAKHAKLAIYGNHDHGGYFTEQYEELLKNSHFILLKNEEKSFYLNKRKISFIGLDDYMLGKRKYNTILERIQKNAYTIVLAHEPDIANITKKYPIHLQLSGHSHGGQIYFPFFKSFIMPPFAKTYNRGIYRLSSQFDQFLVVSNGIGTTKLPLRFLTPPEIVSIQIKNN